MHKVWYRKRSDERLEVEVVVDREGALRRAAAILTSRSPDRPIFVGIEDEAGAEVLMDDVFDYVRTCETRSARDERREQRSDKVVCSKYYVEVQPLPSMRRHVEDQWVRWAIETTRVRADVQAREAGEMFGFDRVQVISVV